MSESPLHPVATDSGGTASGRFQVLILRNTMRACHHLHPHLGRRRRRRLRNQLNIALWQSQSTRALCCFSSLFNASVNNNHQQQQQPVYCDFNSLRADANALILKCRPADDDNHAAIASYSLAASRKWAGSKEREREVRNL